MVTELNRYELKAICKEKNVFQYQIAEKLNVSEPTFIRWMRKPVTGDLEKRIIEAINKISEENKKEGSSHV